MRIARCVATGDPPFFINPSTIKVRCSPNHAMVYIENGTYPAVRRRASYHFTRSPPEAMILQNWGVLSAAPCTSANCKEQSGSQFSNAIHFVESKFPSQSSRQQHFGLYSKSNNSKFLLCFPKIHFCIIFPSTLRSFEWSPSLHIRNKSVHAPLCTAMHTKYLTRLSLLDLIILKILGELKIRNLLYIRHYVSSCLFSLLLPNALLSNLFLKPITYKITFSIHRVTVNLHALCT